MKKRKFYNYLSKKYNLPYEYIAFKINPYYIWKATIELSLERLEEIENSFNWDFIQADFERDRNTYSSVFYGMQKGAKTMEKALLFTRKFNGETYKFFLNKGIGCLGIYSEYVSVETPENCFGYTDTVLFNHGKAYTLHRYLQNWILKAITETLVKKGYSAYMQ